MILFTHHADYRGATAIFGRGLIGSALIRQMLRQRFCPRKSLQFDWDAFRPDSELYRMARDEFQAGIAQAGTLSGDTPRINVVWSAGKAGFSADARSTESDLQSFATLLKLIEEVQDLQPDLEVRFFHFSSAGGLFEGQSCVTPDTIPLPTRLYGRLKLDQELLLSSCPIRMRRTIYRPSSVYGYIRLNHRMGLIPTMVLNGLRQTVTSIYGNHTTLRDFVWVEDIARHVCEALRREISEDSVSFLLSGRPVSLNEVRLAVETALNRKVYVQYGTDPSNGANITFSHRCKPASWQSTDLSAAIQQILIDYQLETISSRTHYETRGA